MPGVVVANQPGVLLYDADGNPIATTDDGGDYKLETIAKQRNAAGTVISPATENKQDDAITKLTNLDGKDFATEATLDSIKDTDGIKRITDALPTGDNWIGKTKVGDGTNVVDVLDDAGVSRLRVEASQPSGELHNVVLYDAAGNPVGVVLDGTIYRLQADAKVAKGNTSSALVHLEAIDTVAGEGRLKSTLYSPDGDPISFSAVPPNPASIQNDFVRNGGSADLLVDGDPTPVVFTYDADTTYDISLQEIKFVLASNSITFGTDQFGGINSLTNGLLVEIISNGNTGELGNIQQNEDFVNFASPGGFDWVVSSKDMIYATYLIGGGLKLKAGTADKVRVTVRDDIDSAGVYLQCFVKGNLLS